MWPRYFKVRHLKRYPVILTALFLLYHLLYIIPVSPDIWSSLKGRGNIVSGFELVNASLPNLPISMTPEKSIITVLGFLPMITLGVILLDAQKKEMRFALMGMFYVIMLSIVLGIIQFLTKDPIFYLYDITNIGFGVGFFSNVNHQASFAVIGALISVYLYYENRRFSFLSFKVNKKVTTLIGLLLCVIAMVITGSMAGISLFVVLCPFLILLNSRNKRLLLMTSAVSLLLLTVAIATNILFMDGHLLKGLNEIQTSGAMSRTGIWVGTMDAIKNVGFFGSGPGSFQTVFLLFEDQSNLTKTFAPQAHNDFLQIVLELGFIGCAFIIALIGWLAFQTAKLFIDVRYADRALILSLVALLALILHSLVDYPLRTPASGAIFLYFLFLLDKPDLLDA